MPPIETAFRCQTAVLWEADGYDDYGSPKVLAPVELNVRWEEVQTEALDAKGNTIAIDAVVVVDRVIAEGSIMWQGKLDDIPGTTGIPTDGNLKQVIKYSDIPDIKARYCRRLVYLMRWSDVLPNLA